MLDVVSHKVKSRRYPSFEERFIDYLLSIQNQSIMLEMEYIKRHNTLDILKLDKWIEHDLKELYI